MHYIDRAKPVKIVLKSHTCRSLKSCPYFRTVERKSKCMIKEDWMSIFHELLNLTCHFAWLICTLQFQKCCLPVPVLSNVLSKFIYKIASSKKRLPMFKIPYLNAPGSFDCRLFKNTQEITMITIVNCEKKINRLIDLRSYFCNI